MTDKPTKVADIMTRAVVTVYEEEDLTDLGEGMERYGFRHLPVVDGGKLVGLLTHRDLLRASVSYLDPGREERENRLEHNLFVAQIMNRDVQTVSPDTPLADAAKLLRDHKYGCLPVVDDDEQLVGIVTEADFLDLAIRLLE